MIKKYRKKPVVIEAEQFDGKNNPFGCIFETNLAHFNDRPDCTRNKVFGVKTLEGDYQVKESDYIIKGIKGEYYPCRQDIFEETYELVD